ncbi:hypothetical protein ACVIGB_000387 [Bradyrhizobium sp. USDA 4341]
MVTKKTSATSKTSTTVRYDVVWTLPFREFTRQGYTASQTWWLDSMHRDQITANKRFNAVKDAIVGGNGTIMLFEVEADRGSDVFHQRLVNRAGRQTTPPAITEINMTAVDIDREFKVFLTRYHERRGTTQQPQTVQKRVVTVRKQKSSPGPWIAAACAVLSMVGVIVAAFQYQEPAAGAGLKGFNSRGATTVSSSVGTERPTVGIIKVPNDSRKNGRRQCDVMKMDPETLRSVYDHSEDC